MPNESLFKIESVQPEFETFRPFDHKVRNEGLDLSLT